MHSDHVRKRKSPKAALAEARRISQLENCLKTQLYAFKPIYEGGNYQRCVSLENVREIHADGSRSSQQEAVRDTYFREGGEALRQKLPLYDLLSRLDDTEEAERLRQACLVQRKGEHIIVLTPGQYAQLQSAVKNAQAAGRGQ